MTDQIPPLPPHYKVCRFEDADWGEIDLQPRPGLIRDTVIPRHFPHYILTTERPEDALEKWPVSLRGDTGEGGVERLPRPNVSIALASPVLPTPEQVAAMQRLASLCHAIGWECSPRGPIELENFIYGPRFPIMPSRHHGRKGSIPWRMLEPHEPQALRNHDQTLKRLAERGGLSIAEALLVLRDQGFDEFRDTEDPTELVKMVNDWIGENPPPFDFLLLRSEVWQEHSHIPINQFWTTSHTDPDHLLDLYEQAQAAGMECWLQGESR